MMATERRFDRAEYEARKAARDKVQAGHATAQNVPQLREIVSALCRALGVVTDEAETEATPGGKGK